MDPTYTGYIPIICLTKSTQYGALGPYELKDELGVIFENKYQFSKVYPKSPANTEYFPYTQKQRITHDRKFRRNWRSNYHLPGRAEIHAIPVEKGLPGKDGTYQLQPAFFEWQRRGFFNPDWVRYPPGYHNMSQCVGFYLPGEDHLLTYIESRIKFYAKEYIRLVPETTSVCSIG